MRDYAQKAQSIVLREGRVLCEKLEKINRAFPADSIMTAEPLMKLPEKPHLPAEATVEHLQEQIMYELKLNANYKEALVSLEPEMEAIFTDKYLIEKEKVVI